MLKADEASHEPDYAPEQQEAAAEQEEVDWGDYWKKIDAEQDAQIAAKEQQETGEAPVPALPPLEETLAKEYPIVNIPVSDIPGIARRVSIQVKCGRIGCKRYH